MVKITIPFGNGGKIELDGNFEQVKAEVEKIDELFQKLNTAIGHTVTIQKENPITITALSAQLESPSEIPQIPVDLKKSPTNAIAYLLESPWGQKGKRKEELNQALETNMVYKSGGYISAIISQLVASNKIGRREEQGEWKYYPNPK